ncbi:MAG: BioY family transporter [Candidatus Pelagibacter sp.]|nr:BioY family transporter [Candidatus Pelagibacter sp.]OUW67340.1 MAG: BioY family transporter [Candidatus Pelagibacter sp. TMED202]|tara:strand:- start:682 stop:1245 length:564 start_codon:yes stop_codon:yes gene_type:complete
MESVKNLKQIKILKYFFVILVSSILLAISAKLKIPFYPVPMTMQTFIVLLIGVCFGWKLGGAIISLYLLEGIIGLPVFSGTPEKGLGIVYFVGPTMGYLLGFVFAAMLSGIFKFDKNIILNFLKLVLSVSIIYILGIMWLGILIGWDKPIINLGVTPFLLAELFKITLLSVIITLFNDKLSDFKNWI